MRRVSLLGRPGERGVFDELMTRHMGAFFWAWDFVPHRPSWGKVAVHCSVFSFPVQIEDSSMIHPTPYLVSSAP